MKNNGVLKAILGLLVLGYLCACGEVPVHESTASAESSQSLLNQREVNQQNMDGQLSLSVIDSRDQGHQNANEESRLNAEDLSFESDSDAETADSEDPAVDDSSSIDPGIQVVFDHEQSEGVLRWGAPSDIRYSNARISISNAQGEAAVRDFKEGEAIELYGDLPDGSYGWKSVVTPSIDEYTREQMREVRESGDFAAEQELKAQLRAQGSIPTEQEARDNVQYGSFIVLNGVVNPAPLEEAESTMR